MVFSANPLSLSVPEPAFESWLRDSGYLEILDERTTNLDHHSSYSSNNQSDKKTTTTAAASSTTKSSSSSTITSTSTINYTLFALSFSYLSIIFSLFTLNPFAKLTTDDFSGNTPSWTVGFIGSFDSYSFPSTPSQAKLRVHENIKRYARNYATLLVLFFACSLYQMPVSLLGLVSGLALWDGVRYCSHRWNLEAYPSLKLTLVRFAQCATAVILYCSSVQIATFWAIAVGYAVMLMHASLRKLSPSKQSARADGNKRFLQSKNRG
ncbi:PRA1 family protein H-like [Papaver somniferum]|uniref:PRA1 family protein H-like n=1 Tax=Papaver somniferum TaxID=3469 RepID=UPI000E6FF1F3|nr:PRA1 family protein H-like [Papaver somniferum]